MEVRLDGDIPSPSIPEDAGAVSDPVDSVVPSTSDSVSGSQTLVRWGLISFMVALLYCCAYKKRKYS